MRRWILCCLLLVAALLAFRVAVWRSWHAPAGDGVQYHALSQQLAQHHRYAWADPSAPPTYTRLPGYPLFLAYVAVRSAPLPLGRHVERATLVNIAIDVVTATLTAVLFFVAFGEGSALPGILVLGCPLLILCSTYALTESLATCLCTAELLLALLLARRGALAWAALLGAVMGASLLLRADALTVHVAVLAMLARQSAAPVRRRALGAALVALAIFAPWPLRNVCLFGAPHPLSSSSRFFDGEALPEPFYAWLRTWATSDRSEGNVEFWTVLRRRIDAREPVLVPPHAYDTLEERERLVALFDELDHTRFSPAVARQFSDLAEARRRARPLRYYVLLPLQRVAHLFGPAPESELPMRVPWLHLPAYRPLFQVYDYVLYLGAAVGLVLSWRSRRARDLTAAILLAWLGRVALYAVAIPHLANKRFIVELYPTLVLYFVLAARQAQTKIPPFRALP